MKKMCLVALACFTPFALAESAVENQGEMNKAQAETLNFSDAMKQNRPVAMLQVYNSAGKRTLMKGNSLSRSKQRELCIVIDNVKAQETNQLVEFFKAPNAINMDSQGNSVQVSEDKKEHLITFTLPQSAVKNNQVSQCWRFDQQDPIGTYYLDVQFNDVVFKGLSFRILK